MESMISLDAGSTPARNKRPGKEELRSNLRSILSEISTNRIDERRDINRNLKRIASLEILDPYFDELIEEKEIRWENETDRMIDEINKDLDSILMEFI